MSNNASNAEPVEIDFGKKDAIKQILPVKPVITSYNAGWNGIYLEYHKQPAHETPEYSFPHHTISVGLGYSAREFKVNGRLLKDFVVGNVGICPANQNIKTQAYGNAEFLLLSVDSTYFARSVSVDTDEVEIAPKFLNFDPLVYQMALALKTELESGGTDSCLYAESMATALSVHLLRRYATRKQVIKEYTTGLPNYKLRQAIAYIQENLDQNITLGSMAALLQMSPHYFASLFKQSTGLAPHQYVSQCRIEKAKHLLTKQELRIIDICQEVGFQSQSHFTKIFRKYTGATPKAYRDSL